jgi:RND family efflux transporter MFP subunit
MALSLQVGAQTTDRIEIGITQPSSRKEIAFPFTGIISEVAVKEGEAVKKGQLLMTQDARIEQKRLEGLKLEADRSALISAREASLANKIVVVKRKQETFDKGALSLSELQEAQLDVKLAEAELELAKQEGRVKTNEMENQAIRVELLKLLAPSDGIVESIKLTEGEVAGIDKPSIVIVKNDPLYIDVKTLPAKDVQKLKSGQELEVRYNGEAWAKAKINLIVPVADARAQTQAIRLEMPNPEGRWTGVPIEVKIPTAADTTAAK